MPEQIDCAAVRYNGKLYTGPMHADAAFAAALDAGLCTEQDDIGTGYEAVYSALEDGFVTTRGRFVDRATAMRIARAADQDRHSGGDDVLLTEYL